MAQQSSRLQRLLTLLDTGSTQATRLTAARQIGDIAKSHPQDLTSLLKKVSQYLRSKNWDTRVAAAHAIGSIAENVKHISLTELFASVLSKMSENGISCSIEDLCAWPYLQSKITGSAFRSFDMNKVLEFGALLASGGQEYDIGNDSIKNPKERLVRQKQNLRRRLGLDVCEQFMDISDVIRDEDLMVSKSDPHLNGIDRRVFTSCSAHNIQKMVANMVPSVKSKWPSARELNLLKRKAKINSKDQTKGWCEDGGTEASGAQNLTPKGTCPDSLNYSKVFMDVNHDDDGFEHDGDGQWPFHTFVEQLIIDMFDPVWEVRHGSVMALREILAHQGASAGVFKPDSHLGGTLFIELEDKSIPTTLKREREIDLNMQVSADEFDSNLKRPKLEDVSSPTFMDSVMTCNNITSETLGCNLTLDYENGQFNGNSNDMDLESHSDGSRDACKESASITEEKGHLDDNQMPSGNLIALRNLPQNCELMNSVKVARSSWLQNCEFLQDCVIRFLCVLSLDRFGDYVSDQVVAPVRETCAQALGAAFKYMHPALVNETLNILLRMQCRPEWEIRHGSLLGIKYLVAVRQEMLSDLLGGVLPACKSGLEDPDDDVRAVAADALIPAASAIVSLQDQTLHSIVMLLWDILLDLDDLSPSTSSVMNLLAEIYSQEDMSPNMYEVLRLGDKEMENGGGGGGGDCDGEENPYVLSTLAQRLWPFMRHSITSVRYSAIRTLERLLEAGYKRSMSELSGASFWPSSIFGDTLRIVFQNLLLETNEDILQCSERVWSLLVQCSMEDLEMAASSYGASWIELASTPFGSALDASKMYWPVAFPRKSQIRAAAKMRAAKIENEFGMEFSLDSIKGSIPQDRNGDVPMNSVKIVVGADVDTSVTHTRVVTATALGYFASKLPVGSLKYVIDPLWSSLTSFSGVQRQVASMVLISWFKEIKLNNSSKNLDGIPGALKGWLLDLLACSDPAFPTKDSLLPYAELSRTYAKMRSEAGQLLNVIKSSGMFDELLTATQIELDRLSVDDAIGFASKIPALCNDSSANEFLAKNIMDDIESSKQRLLTTSGYLKCVQSNLHVTVTSAVAAAVVWMSEFPTRLTPIILPLMASIRREQEEILQMKSAEALAELMYHCVARKPCPNDKLIKNICSLTCMDPSETPQAKSLCTIESIDDQGLLSFRTPVSKQKSKVHVLAGEDRSKVEGFLSRRGSELSLRLLCEKFGASLFDKLPKLWDCLTEVLKPIEDTEEKQVTVSIESVSDPQTLINNIQVVRSVAPVLNELKPKLLTLLPCIFKCVQHSHVAVRLAASRCITSLAQSMTVKVMGAVVENAIPMLEDSSSVYARQGAGMLISFLVQGLGVELVPYAPLLVVPLLRCMSDCDQSVRQSVTHSFAALVPLLPLARGLPQPIGLGEGVSRNAEDLQFLEQLLDNSHIEDYKLCTELKVTLRRYQQEGINWLAFLKRFKLHGILCDDMGLGKTLQASAIVASDIAEHRSTIGNEDLLASLIICPSTLVGHWAFEIEKYIDVSVISSLQYVGSAQERILLRDQFCKHNVIITSYDVVRKDVDFLGQLLWNYCILDEGHIIKNAKSKVTLAVKQLKAQHRLILSGTPIQNNIMDLWSLFDFLMPGFLGTERQFQAAYGKPLLAARDPKCSAKDAEAGVLAMEALHKQVMPFLLRRTKDEVLSDLPEKIIQDRYCDLSPVQYKLYEQFSGSRVKQEMSSIVTTNESAAPEGSGTSTKASSHVFQALQYLLKLCSHPLLVTGEKIPDSLSPILLELFPAGSDIVSELHKLHHSPKLVALHEILEECGIGVDNSGSEGAVNVGQHRVLIFAQHKAFLDIIERDLFQTHMKSVTYLRLDGSVASEKRFEIVKAFNSDPTIDVLLLTTHVGGLGLNLTSADTLVFVEHDWNPMRDHQAMDRAHRLGQKKVVNVHRLIMRGTLEEKVMSLQRFKVSVANAVINAENASMKTMNTDQLLDLFASAETSKKGANAVKSSENNSDGDAKLVGSGKRLKSILGGLEELWDQSQYTEEYNLSQFLARLNG
ncbi:TATA-binding protein-associated factor BTAF1 isoform X1 [Vigna radiata var. radiata]|uniref:TATA-binding protein-associated factor BTAF1 isoform X1 n=2 Tax=Vigna radiata var. radiata TaxID=3916 RepID=A0A1S3TJ73_VIGRR|nr:TATA-binding protein-associated factor BTAF1 isoform X1 [Vigna radiata var. radiata]XP_022632557.1 TATA-binding protein-associated factor BTAF1 isoform X1 [Vigna radiata var. radiata]XP_022632560.1 TATA-binding protein-associated factor BTAF1 isoform X1 [Vigna radiata var. radiata]XP_022632567.1 TATA-binding protein-associated factor BTAF1 isoform X1 [Vigna radiata var. radiata]